MPPEVVQQVNEADRFIQAHQTLFEEWSAEIEARPAPPSGAGMFGHRQLAIDHTIRLVTVTRNEFAHLQMALGNASVGMPSSSLLFTRLTRCRAQLIQLESAALKILTHLKKLGSNPQ